MQSKHGQNLEERLKNVTFKDQKDFLQEFDMNEKQELSKRGKCITYSMTSKINKKNYAIRYVELDKDKNLTKEQVVELKRSKLVRHTNVLKYYDIYNWEDNGKVYYVVKCDYTNQTINSIIDVLSQDKKKRFSDVQLLWILKQNVDILEYLSENFQQNNMNICPENMQTAGEDVWKISGYDHSLDQVMELPNYEDSVYLAPEYREAKKNGTLDKIDLIKADIFALGMVFARCAGVLKEEDIQGLNKAFDEETQEKQTKFLRTPKIVAGGSKKFQANIIEACIRLDPTKRITLKDLRTKLNCCTIRQELQK